MLLIYSNCGSWNGSCNVRFIVLDLWKTIMAITDHRFYCHKRDFGVCAVEYSLVSTLVLSRIQENTPLTNGQKVEI